MRPDSTLVATLSPSPNFGSRNGRSIEVLILHYTGMSTGPAAQTRLLDPQAQVSCHYLVWEDGRIEQMVAEADRAWHAGLASWAGETHVNAISIGIEIVNAGHDGGSPPYPAAQIAAVATLAKDVCRRHGIPPHRVLAHSDVAADRKCDPGEWFPWAQLATDGIGLWVEPEGGNDESIGPGQSGTEVSRLQEDLVAFGYCCPVSGRFDDPTKSVVLAFQRHYRPERLDGIADNATRATLQRLLSIRPRDA